MNASNPGGSNDPKKLNRPDNPIGSPGISPKSNDTIQDMLDFNLFDFDINDFSDDFNDIFTFDPGPWIRTDLTRFNKSNTSSNASLVGRRQLMPAFEDVNELNIFLNHAFFCGKNKIPMKEKKFIFNFIKERHDSNSDNSRIIKKLSSRDLRKCSNLDKRLMEIGDLIKLSLRDDQQDFKDCLFNINLSRRKDSTLRSQHNQYSFLKK